jgi:hypothetical protein
MPLHVTVGKTMADSDSGNLTADSFADEGIAVVDLADELQVRKQTIFKVLKRLGIQATRRREMDRGNQYIAVISNVEVDAVRIELSRTARSKQPSLSGSDAVYLNEEFGVFYLMQLEPDHDPGRFKVGFTTDLEGRLRKHRCSAPFIRPLKSWPCRRTWERAAMDCMTIEAEKLHTEVFRAKSLESIGERGDRFFSLMPSLAGESEVVDEDAPIESGAG